MFSRCFFTVLAAMKSLRAASWLLAPEATRAQDFELPFAEPLGGPDRGTRRGFAQDEDAVSKRAIRSTGRRAFEQWPDGRALIEKSTIGLRRRVRVRRSGFAQVETFFR